MAGLLETPFAHQYWLGRVTMSCQSVLEELHYPLFLDARLNISMGETDRGSFR